MHQNQAQLLSYHYSAYGQTVASTGGETYDNRIRYTGGYLNTDTGPYKPGIRYYDPAADRFTQPDPTGQDPGYIYSGNNPLVNVDPSGAGFFGIDCPFGETDSGGCNGAGGYDVVVEQTTKATGRGLGTGAVAGAGGPLEEFLLAGHREPPPVLSRESPEAA